MKRIRTAFMIINALACAISSDLFAAAAEPAPTHAQDWPTTGGTYYEQRYSPLTQIDTHTIDRLRLSWFYDLDTNRGQESTPLVVDGVMYVTTAWSKVFALDAANGRLRWKYDPLVPGKTGLNACCDVVNRGAAYEDHRVFVGTLDGRLVALDSRNGHVLWSVVTVDQRKPYTITGAPRVVNGKVIIGNGGAEYGLRGYVTAYDARTGKLVWRFYTVPGDPKAGPDGAASDKAIETVARSTWYGNYWQNGGGGTVWDAIVYDPDLKQLYIGVGNGSPWNRRIRSEGRGDNLFLSSIVALDPETGRYLWHYQETPGEQWDFTASQQITLADLQIEGVPRKVILHAPKNGFFYVIDRRTGQLISAEKFAPVNWASLVDPATGRPVEAKNARYTDGPFAANSGASGAHNWQPMAFSPRTGLVYIPAQMIGFLYVDDVNFKYNPGAWNLGVDMLAMPLPATPADRAAMTQSLKGWLAAWDPIHQREVWRVDHGKPWNGGTLATAGDVVFQGTADGKFHGYDATDGRELWSFDAQTAVMAGPISFSVGAKQYIAVMAGNGGGVPLALPAFDGPTASPNGRVLVFALDGHARLPDFTPVIAALQSVPDHWSESAISRGSALYAANCSACHGIGAYSGGVVPDLRRSSLLNDRAAWHAVVIGGQLQTAGMVSFAGRLGDDDADAIRDFVAAQAKQAMEAAGMK